MVATVAHGVREEVSVYALDDPVTCKIQFCGTIDPARIAIIYDIEVSYEADENDFPLLTLQGKFSDYAAVYGLLNYLYSQRLTLVSFQRF